MAESKTKVYILRYGSGACPESYILGLYPNRELTNARIEKLISEGWSEGELWADIVSVGANGADLFLSNC